MPNPGDELHHFGWNACSSCLCPNAPHPHVERRYLVVPGLRSSRIHILDTKPDPKNPKIVRVIEAEEIASKAGYSRPHTIHCGPEGIYVSALGNAEGKAPGRRVPDGPRELRRARPLGDRPRAAGARLRLLVASRPRHHGHQRVGHAGHLRERARARGPAGRQVWPPPALLGPAQAQAPAGDRPRHRSSSSSSSCGRHTTRPRPTASSACVDQPQGPLLLDLDLVPRRRRLGGEEGHRDPGRARRPRPAAGDAQGLQGRAAARHRHRPVDGRPVPLRLVLGHRRHAASTTSPTRSRRC